MFLHKKDTLVRQFGRIQYEQSAELGSTYLGELIAPYSFEVFDFMFALDPKTLQATSVHPPAMHLIFKTNPFTAQCWVMGTTVLLILPVLK